MGRCIAQAFVLHSDPTATFFVLLEGVIDDIIDNSSPSPVAGGRQIYPGDCHASEETVLSPRQQVLLSRSSPPRS